MIKSEKPSLKKLLIAFVLKFNDQFLTKLKLNVQVNAPTHIVSDLAKMRPIIFSHDYVDHRHYSSCLMKQLASEGFIVFSLEHYMTSQTEEVQPHYQSAKQKNDHLQQIKQNRFANLDNRITQVKALLDFIYSKEQISALLGKGIDLDKATMVGNGLGGSCALLAGIRDSRICGIVSIDPIVYFLQEQYKKSQLDQTVLVLQSEYFTNSMKLYSIKQLTHQFMEGQRDKRNKLLITLKNSGHFNFSDCGFLYPGPFQQQMQIGNKNEVLYFYEKYSKLVISFISKLIYSKQGMYEADKLKLIVEQFEDQVSTEICKDSYTINFK